MGLKNIVTNFFDGDEKKDADKKSADSLQKVQNPLYWNENQSNLNDNLIRPDLEYRSKQINNVNNMYNDPYTVNNSGIKNNYNHYEKSNVNNSYYNHDFDTIEKLKNNQIQTHDPHRNFDLHNNIIQPTNKLKDNSNKENLKHQYKVVREPKENTFEYSPTIEKTLEHNIYIRDDGDVIKKKTTKNKQTSLNTNHSAGSYFQKKNFSKELINTDRKIGQINSDVEIDNLDNFNKPKSSNYGFIEKTKDKEINKQNRKEIFDNYVPKFIVKEIVLEKWKSFITAFLTGIGLIISLAFISFFYYGKNHNMNEIFGMNVNSLPKPFWTIILSIGCFVVFMFSLFNFKRAVVEAEKTGKAYANNEQILPTFITDNYKKSITNKIVVNWIAGVVYVVGLIVLGFLIFLNVHSGESVTFIFWSTQPIGDLSIDITINVILLSLMFAYHILTIVLSRKKEINIKSHFGYDIIDFETKTKIKKATNKKCLIWFLIIVTVLFIFVIIPVLIFKKRKNGHWVWPWQTQSVVNR
ncbi:MSC_0882 family membrane protein [Spiroplasma endosymbiont of Amphibalanus improvisus]|uniref:MSC_0882 family membrane protein n=1 Tax=Spiroplasma endosymbiont of Amphibalanus improvisus TaxID=3066327 RepID=UPI00313F165F